MGKRPGTSNIVRIIGGDYRGRRITFPDATGLRPTADRIRETLFNWLQPVIVGANCLDLFSGSGALGFEAASRGAKHVKMIERNAKVADRLRGNVAELKIDNVDVIKADALNWISQASSPYNVVFADPPFADKLLPRVLDGLIESDLLADGAAVYLESDANDGFPEMPEGLTLTRDKRAGQVIYGLARYCVDES